MSLIEPQDLRHHLEIWHHIAQEGSFEEAIDALDQVVLHLDDGNLPLQLTVECYELGALLAKRCQYLIDEAELRISRVEVLGDTEDDE
jgi:exodeoxyribonuclease VII small subunit